MTLKTSMAIALSGVFLIAAGSGSGADSDQAAQKTELASASGSPATACDNQSVKVGETLAINLAGAGLHWDTSGDIVTLAKATSGKEVELVVSTAAGGPSPPLNDCLKSGSYIRFASSKHTVPNRYLQAFQAANPNNVQIGNFPDPGIDSIFYVKKVGGQLGDVIKRGDEVLIRGVSRDPWLVAPVGAAVGTAIGLSVNETDAAKWTLGNKGDGQGG